MSEVRIVGVRGPAGLPWVAVYQGQDVTTLDPARRVRNHSPDGFEWGYGGSGPAQLALAILCFVLCDDNAAQDAYQDFKRDVIARLPWHAWEMTPDSVWNWWMENAAFPPYADACSGKGECPCPTM